MFGSKQIEKAMSGEATDKKANRKAKFAQLKEKGMGLQMNAMRIVTSLRES